jgi:hypothetical protein
MHCLLLTPDRRCDLPLLQAVIAAGTLLNTLKHMEVQDVTEQKIT